MAPAGRELILGVSGSIAAYKAVYLLRELARQGDRVTVVTTAHAERFVGALTWRTLSGRPVLSDLFDPHRHRAVEHVGSPSGTGARDRAGHRECPRQGCPRLADDFLTTLSRRTCPVLMAPAMDGGMWDILRRRQRAHAPRARVPSSSPRSAISRPGSGQGPVAGGGDDRRASRASAHPRARSPGRADPRDSGPTREHHRSRPVSLEPLVGQDGQPSNGVPAPRAEVVLISGPTALRPPRAPSTSPCRRRRRCARRRSSTSEPLPS